MTVLHCAENHRQHGLALLMLLALVVLTTLTLFVEQLNAARIRARRAEISDAALAQAKEALIAYALTYGDSHPNKVPGYLLCPETGSPAIATPEGSADLSCGTKNVSVIGRLPWRTLGLEPLKDGARECLWYAVSGSYKNNPGTDMLNWDTDGQLTVQGADGGSVGASAAIQERAAAVIFAPGPATGVQDRSAAADTAICGGNYNPANYLEASGGADNSAVAPGAGAVSTFVAGGAGNGVNDRLIVITAHDIFAAITKRADFQARLDGLTRHLAQCIAGYGTRNAAGPADRRLPWAAPVALADYSANARYEDQAGTLSGRLPFRLKHSKRATANIMASTELDSSCPEVWSAADDEWYKNWKDQFFYMAAGGFSPAAATSGACPPCLSSNGSGSYAAIVVFAGARLASQHRQTSADRTQIANYLEDRNSASHPNAGGNADYRSGPASAGFNDKLYCIDIGLGVAPCL
ncbi:MAG TPA: hypothetical protein VMV33_09535 [Rhodocyclaceae bacterium]|nr:hypothetical protein [Rhodocyclaceae bacterium]